ncbi:hypothetical protein [uncultured Methanofollis sp.]|uniref:hypothetical protein n=1 Tax=uncultured Methanofollis sp. TaxID=262500 RepID=UPI0026069A03|nr:hypothetical protein [uncultured Methanofollis sp.]
MHAERIVLSLLIAAALLFVPCAAATGDAESADRITVSPADDRYDIAGPGNVIQSINDRIYPGETDPISKNIPTGTKKISIRLDWSGHPHSGTDSVSLTIYTPDGGRYGPYLDSADGKIDEKISLDLSDSPSLPSGKWQFNVRGDSVPKEGDAYTLNVLYS